MKAIRPIGAFESSSTRMSMFEAGVFSPRATEPKIAAWRTTAACKAICEARRVASAVFRRVKSPWRVHVGNLLPRTVALLPNTTRLQPDKVKRVKTLSPGGSRLWQRTIRCRRGEFEVEKFRVALEPTSVPEWDAEDQVFGVLSNDQPVPVDEASARAILEQTNIELPRALDWTALLGPDSASFDFYLIQVPLTLMLPDQQKLVRLRLELTLQAPGAKPEDVLAYDLFPTTRIDVKKIMSGEVSLDVSQALEFVLLASGPGAVLAPGAKCLGLKLELPFQWNSSVVAIQSSARMSNPVRWSLTDSAIQNGFSAAAIIRVPKGTKFSVTANFLGEVRQFNVLGFSKAQFSSLAHIYQVG